MRRINLPPNKHKGMLIYCSKCKKSFSWTKKTTKSNEGKTVIQEPTCGESGKKLSACSNFDKHKFKVRAHVPGTKSRKLTKILDTRSYNEAVIKSIEFQNECLEELKGNIDQGKITIKRIYLIDSQIEYLDYLTVVGVPEHQKVVRTNDYIKEIKNCLLLFNESLANAKINTKIMRLDRIDEIHVGYFHTFLLENMAYSNKTYNGKIGALRSFFKWAIKQYKLKIINPFEGVRNRTVSSENKTISKKEFQDLLDIITPEKGLLQLGGKTKEVKQMYKEYLRDGIELCLHTGGRREEVVELKWNMIHEINGKPGYITINNFKVERRLGDGFNNNVTPKIIPITKGLMNILNRLGYEAKRNTDEYIICPDRSNIPSKSIMDNLSRGFTHYYNQLETGRKLQLKCLRKTYLTYLEAAMKGETKKLSSHTTNEVLHKHYIDEKVIHKAVKEVEIFG